MDKGSLLLGFCPIGKFVFSHEDALRFKRILETKLTEWNVNFVGIDDVVADGVVRAQSDVRPVVDHFRKQRIDALFIPHCNFGTEGAAGVIARDLHVPTLLWGPRDESPLPDGTRLRDTLCGMFATSKVLHKLKVPFTYVENCPVDDEAFTKGFDTFLRAANVVKAMKNMRIGQIGQRIDFFWTTIMNESEILEKFGIEVLPLDMVDFLNDVKASARDNRKALLEELESLKQRMTFEGFKSEDQLVNMIAMRDVMLQRARDNQLNAIAIQTLVSLCNELNCTACYPSALVTDADIPVVCETDILGAVSSVMLYAASWGQDPIMFADLTVRHPENDNGILIWHSSFPESLKEPDTRSMIGDHWIVRGVAPGSCNWRTKKGPLTIFRFDGDGGEYKAITGQGKAIDGPKTNDTYVWAEVNNWPEWERKFIYGPYMHHVACCYGHYQAVMREACKYIPGIEHEDLP